MREITLLPQSCKLPLFSFSLSSPFPSSHSTHFSRKETPTINRDAYQVSLLSPTSLSSTQRHVISSLERQFHDLGTYLLFYLSPSREKSIAISKLNDALLYAKQASIEDLSPSPDAPKP